jgi:hypothetical protein
VDGTDVNETQGLKSLFYYKSLRFCLRGTYVQAPTFHLFQLYPTIIHLLLRSPSINQRRLLILFPCFGSHLLTSELLDGGSHLLTSELLDGGLLDERRKTCEWANNVKVACFFFLN